MADREVVARAAELREQIERLPGGIEEGHLSAAAKHALQLHTDLRVTEPEAMTTAKLNRLGIEIGNLAGLIADAYFV